MDKQALRPFRWGAFFLLISAALHVFAWVPAGLSTDATALLPLGLVYAAVGAVGLLGRRWFAYLAYFLASIGAIFLLGFVWSTSAVSAWWYVAMIAANTLGAIFLFTGLWRRPAVLTPV